MRRHSSREFEATVSRRTARGAQGNGLFREAGFYRAFVQPPVIVHLTLDMLSATSPICVAIPWVLRFSSTDECPQEIMLAALLGLAVVIVSRAKGKSRLTALGLGCGCFYIPLVFSLMFMPWRVREETVGWFPLIALNLLPNALLGAITGLLVWELSHFFWAKPRR